jgi:hypothetical protein
MSTSMRYYEMPTNREEGPRLQDCCIEIGTGSGDKDPESIMLMMTIKDKLREDSATYVNCYQITSITSYMKLSRNFIFLSESCLSQKRKHTVVS